MKISWLRDPKSHAQLWWPLDQKPLKFLDASARPLVLDIGGDDGSLTRPLAERGGRVVVLDINRAALRLVSPDASAVQADVRHLPFKDGSFHGAAARATLHHVPSELRGVLGEISRVLAHDGLFVLQEPLAGNPIYAGIRSLFPTSWHDVDERPLPWNEYIQATSAYLEISEVSPHFLLTYVIPFLIPRLRLSIRHGDLLLQYLDRLDQRVLCLLPGLARYAAYIHILARKRSSTGGNEAGHGA